MRYKFDEPEDISGKKNKSGRICRTCGERIEDHKRKVFNRWICDLVQLDNGHWIHSRRIIEAELAGHTVVYKLIEDV